VTRCEWCRIEVAPSNLGELRYRFTPDGLDVHYRVCAECLTLLAQLVSNLQRVSLILG
jgi:hypothetical protein